MHEQKPTANLRTKKPVHTKNNNLRSKNKAFLLWFLLGIFSAHRFYIGRNVSAVIYLLTGQLLFVGWVVDLFILGELVDEYNNKDGPVASTGSATG